MQVRMVMQHLFLTARTTPRMRGLARVRTRTYLGCPACNSSSGLELLCFFFLFYYYYVTFFLELFF